MELIEVFTKATIFPIAKMGNIIFRGYFTYRRIYYNHENFSDFLKFGDTIEFIKSVISEMNGFFFLIIEERESLLLVVDKIRAFPIYYCTDNNTVYVSDNVEYLQNYRMSYSEDYVLNMDTIYKAKSDFLFVPLNKTLFDQIYQLEAGTWIEVTKGDIHTEQYVSYDNSDIDVSLANPEAFKKTYDETADNLVTSLAGKMVVIPLSGGADSRVILEMLVERKYSNIICFTYGTRNSKDVQISEKVAEKYDIPWYFFEYKKEDWKELKKSGILDHYYMFSGGASLPHIGDLLAVYKLTKSGILAENSIFIPGHTGDLLTGGHIMNELITQDYFTLDMVKRIINKKFFPNNQQCNILPVQIKNNITNLELDNILTNINIKERQGKYICNSVRVYEFFGYEWRTPLWNNEQLQYWEKIPLDKKYDRIFYFDCVNNCELTKKEAIESTNDGNTIRWLAKKIKESPLKKLLRKLLRIRNLLKDELQLSAFATKKEILETLLGKEKSNPLIYVIKDYRNYLLNKYEDK